MQQFIAKTLKVSHVYLVEGPLTFNPKDVDSIPGFAPRCFYSKKSWETSWRNQLESAQTKNRRGVAVNYH